jgi:cytochrome P450
VTGLTNIRYQDIDGWSQAMIEGIANYTGDPAIEARCHAATAGIDAAIDDMLPVVTKAPNHSLLSVMLHGGMPEQNVRANIKLTISGGQNEPRKAIAGTIWALLTHPAQFELVRTGKVGWLAVFEEFARWISPIGMSPRRIAKPWSINGVDLEPEDRVFLMFGSANRDEDHFADADKFDLTRDTAKSIAFGAGPHFCAGAAASRAMIADVALPSVFARLRNLTLDRSEPVRIGGWAFRGLMNLPVIWDT